MLENAPRTKLTFRCVNIKFEQVKTHLKNSHIEIVIVPFSFMMQLTKRFLWQTYKRKLIIQKKASTRDFPDRRQDKFELQIKFLIACQSNSILSTDRQMFIKRLSLDHL